jgi:6-pyruvoyltetrahydropterin/6-carboxytetrahydropterin synthase
LQLGKTMIKLTKIFHFEMAHAIDGYNGKCKNIHGHSYELHVCVAEKTSRETYLDAPGFIIDFKELKQIVQEQIVQVLDHSLVLSEAYLQKFPALIQLENLQVWKFEPTAENILFYIKEKLEIAMPSNVQLMQLKLYETKDSYAAWIKN